MEKNYTHLQLQINELIRKTGGVDKAIEFLEGVLQSNSRHDISAFITFSVANYYGIPVEGILGSGDGYANSDCRRVCYQIHKEILGLSIRKTGAIYNRKENTVMLALRRMSEIIEDPKLDIRSYECYIYVKGAVQKAVNLSNENK